MRRIAILSCAAALAATLACDRNTKTDIDSARPEARPAESPPTEGRPGELATGGGPAVGAPAVGDPAAGEMAKTTDKRRRAEADFEPVKGMKIDGDAELEEVENGVRIKVEVDDAPVGVKGIHIHEKGDCSDPKNKTMGSHFNPGAKAHGMPGAAERHAGDLGNIEIKDNGEGKLEIVANNVNLRPNDPMSILGRAIIIHTAKDTGAQPTGGSGDPIACAVIRED